MTKTWVEVVDQPLAAWAGLWRPSDEWGDCYTGVMVDAIDEHMLEIHDRMPVILRPQDHAAWLGAPAQEATELVMQYPATLLTVSRTIEPWAARNSLTSDQESLPLI